ncbi:MAG: bifunctional folylpolyglutamate synthase/dihydrofolate synthase [Deltaproteobacteria bacterium]|nr:bifunctional folylpolyglutamate synthase/dihydrofolate synthase [Deltaproteobacteria bacterium]
MSPLRKSAVELNRQIAALFKLRRFGIRLGLDRVREAAARLGNPERRFRVVHVAGTNGKGSTAAMCERILRANGYRVGLTTSPHLVHLHERYLVNGRAITDAALARHLARIRETGLPLTFFEVATLAALLHFAEARVNWGVVEVGLGGRLDATNIVIPDVVILTPVALDHTEHLGDTLTTIAREKLGIVKRGVPVVCGWREPSLQRLVERKCAALDAPLSLVGRDFDSAPLTLKRRGEKFTYSDDRSSRSFEVSLAGRHQVTNAALAIRAMRTLGVANSTISAGLRHIRWPGRFDRVGRFILDGAHNPHGIRALVAELSRRFPGSRFPIVFAAMRDKAIPEMLRALAPVASHFHFVRVDNTRGINLAELYALSRTLAISSSRHSTIGAALGATHSVTVITGSLYLVGAALASLRVTGLP